jgi:hypothetical protein
MKGIAVSFWILMLPVSALAAASVGTPVVYVGTDSMGSPPLVSPTEIPASDAQQLMLWIDYDNNAGVNPSTEGITMCVDKNGDETCGFDVLLVMTTDTATFSTFAPPAGLSNVVGYIDSTQTSLRVNGIDTDGMSIPAEIGTLTVNALGANQLQIEVQGMHRVGAAGQLDAIQTQVIVNLPEPGVDLMLAGGVVGLAVLYRLRGRRPSVDK